MTMSYEYRLLEMSTLSLKFNECYQMLILNSTVKSNLIYVFINYQVQLF